MEVNILHTKAKFNQLKARIKEKEQAKEKVPQEMEDDMLSLGLFFLKNIFKILEDDNTQQRDKELLVECLKCTRKAMSKTSFKNFFMMFRYLFIKIDLMRMEGTKLQSTLYSAFFNKPFLTGIIKDSYDKCKKIYYLHKKFFEEPSLNMKIYEYIGNSENHGKVIKELNVSVFGGNKSTENIFMDNIDLHIKEVLVVYKKMMVLLLNFINPQNLAYISSCGNKDMFNAVMGLAIRLQLSISYLICWYYTTQKIDKEKALSGYKDFFTLFLLIDFTCNQSGELLKEYYVKFIDMYFSQILWIGMYFKRNHPGFYPNLEVVLNRAMNQVYKIDLSEDKEDSSSTPTQKAFEKEKSLGKFVDEEEQEEINEQLSSYDLVSMVQPHRNRHADVYENAMLIDLMINNPNYQNLV